MEKVLCLVGLNRPFENQDAGFESLLNLHNGLEKKILEKLDEIQIQQPWFFYIHLMDLHRPCSVPEDFVNLSLSERYNFNIETIDSCVGKILDEFASAAIFSKRVSGTLTRPVLGSIVQKG